MHRDDSLADDPATQEAFNWVTLVEVCQSLLDASAVDLLPGLLRLTRHRNPDIRAAMVSILAARLPHTPEMIAAITPLLHDPVPRVRVRALQKLPDFGALAQPLAAVAYAIVIAEKGSCDQLPRIAAIDFLLSLDVHEWGHLRPELEEIIDRPPDDLAECSALVALLDAVDRW